MHKESYGGLRSQRVTHFFYLYATSSSIYVCAGYTVRSEEPAVVASRCGLKNMYQI